MLDWVWMVLTHKVTLLAVGGALPPDAEIYRYTIEWEAIIRPLAGEAPKPADAEERGAGRRGRGE